MKLLNGPRINVLWSVLGQVGFAALSWIVTVLLARADREGSLVGQFGLASAITLPVLVLCNLQLRTVVVSDARDEFQFSDYFGLRAIALSIAFFVMVAIATMGRFDRDTRLAILAISCIRVVDGVADIVHAYLQRFEQLRRMALSLLVRGLCTLGGVAVGLRLQGSLWASLALVAILLLAELLFLDSWAIRKTRSEAARRGHPWVALTPRFRRSHLKAIFKLSLPLALSGLVGAFATQLPIYVIEHEYGSETLGKFVVIYNPLLAMPIFVVAAFEGVLAHLSAAAATRNRALWLNLFSRLLAIAVSSALILIGGVKLFGRSFLHLVYGQNYAASADLFLLLSIGVGLGFINTILSACLLADRRFKSILILSLVQLPITTALILGLVNRLGVDGAAYALILGQILSMAAYGSMLLRSLYRKPTEWR